ncbi:MAG: glycosyltransferase family 2 protein, partial [Dietzia cercidiphylli]
MSVVVPAYNEQAGVVEATRSLLGLRYHRHEVIIVNDGSKDDTLRVLTEAFDLVRADREIPYSIPTRKVPSGVYVPRDGYTRLTVIDKENSGGSDSVNTGVNAAVEELVIRVDADSVLDPDALLIVTEPFADDPLRTAATGGVVRVANGCTIRDGRILDVRVPRNLLARIQTLEYLRSFFLGRSGWSRLRALILISGAFGCFRRDLLVEVGGLDPDSIGEDFELVMRIHRLLRERNQEYQVAFVPEPVCWTEVPESLSVLKKQRSRWHRGLWETLVKHRAMFGNPRYGRAGTLAVPYYWFFELFAPLIEAVGLVLMVLGFALGLVNPTT